MESETLTFDAPPADMIMAILYEKARNDGRLAAQIEAAQWEAIATRLAIRHNDDSDKDQDDDG